MISRLLCLAASVAMVILCGSHSARAEVYRFYVGTYWNKGASEGIYVSTLDATTGKLGEVKLAGTAKSPSFLALSPDEKRLYAAIEGDKGTAASYAVNADGMLESLNEIACGGGGTNHVWVDPAGKQLFASNYWGGDLAVLPIREDGSLGEASQIIQFEGKGPNEKRQEKPHVHAAYTSRDGRFLYVCDLGTDKITIFGLKDGKLSEAGTATVPPGSGPRHLAFSLDEKWVYVANELIASVTIFKRDGESGALELVSTVMIAPEIEARKAVSEIRMHPNGKWLYVSSRVHDIFTVFEADGNGALKHIQDVPAEVKFPRGFNFDPTGRWLVAMGQSDGKAKTFAIDQATGKLTPTEGHGTVPGSPADVIFVSRPIDG